MKITINENDKIFETEVIINCKKTDEQILQLIAALTVFDQKITGIKDGQTFILETADIIYIDTVDKKTFIYTMDSMYETPQRLYELEKRLSGSDFFRASKSVIANFSQIQSLRPEFGGKMLLTMTGGERIIVSRQYCGVIKQKLGLL